MKVTQDGKTPTEDQIEMWQSVEMGNSVSEVASFRGVKESDVRNAVKKVHRFIASAVAIDVAALKIQMHMRYEGLIHQAMEAFQKSSGKVVVREVKRDKSGIVTEEKVTEKESAGDPRFLNSVDAFMKSQRDLWPGANAPRATALTDPSGEKNARIDILAVISQLSDEEREAVTQYGKIMMSRGLLDQPQ